MGDNQSLPGLIKSERPKSISFMSASSPPEVKRKFCDEAIKNSIRDMIISQNIHFSVSQSI